MKNSTQLAAFCCALLISLGALAATATALNPANGAVLSATAGKGLLHQCSRGTPQHVTGTWTPTRQDIHDLETRLPAALAVEARERGHRYEQQTTFRRQYAGLVMGSRRIIYMNAF